jgi:hypothetical protein
MTEDDDSPDSDPTESSELDPDAYALAEAINQITALLQDHVELYSDLRRQFVEHTLRKSVLSFHSDVIIAREADYHTSSVAPENVIDSRRLREQLGMIAQLLRQLSAERAGAIRSSQEAIAQLQSENARLHEELTQYRQRELDALAGTGGDESENGQTSDPPEPKPPPRSILTPARRSTRTSSGSDAQTPRTRHIFRRERLSVTRSSWRRACHAFM